MDKYHISFSQARRSALLPQGLLGQDYFGRGKSATLKAIESLGYIQIDAISVIERAHHHTLWNRVSNYDSTFLDKLVRVDKKVFEYWSHAITFLPMTDYNYYSWIKECIKEEGKHWYDVDPKMKQLVLERIENEGPLFARDFEGAKRKTGDMWNYSPAKKALHELFMEGRLLAERHNFQRRYDLSERVLPKGLEPKVPSEDEVGEFFIKRYLRSNGFAKPDELGYQNSRLKKVIKRVVPQMLEEGELVSLKIGTKKNFEAIALPSFTDAVSSRIGKKKVRILSPFDNSIIQRKRLERVFAFDYQTEIYLAKTKRRYGYLAMPILYGAEFIGRIDPKADRKNARLIINNLVLDEKVRVDDQ